MYTMKLRSIFKIEQPIKNDNIVGTVCFTGAMEQPRKYYEEIAEDIPLFLEEWYNQKNNFNSNICNKNKNYTRGVEML